MTAVARSIRDMIPGVQSVVIFRPDDEDPRAGLLTPEFGDTPFADYARALELRQGEGWTGRASLGTETILVRDTNAHDMPGPFAAERSVIVAPLLLEPEGQSGLLYVGAPQANAFDEEHRARVEMVSYLAAMAMRNFRLYEHSQRLDLTDEMTGLPTFRVFDSKLAEELEYAERHNQLLVLAMVDVDHLQRYNHAMGALAGDAVLKELAAILKEELTPDRLVCRYGGDEFLMLLRNTSKNEATGLCERIREAISQRFADQEVPLTVSMGLASFPETALHRAALFRAAEDAINTSKLGGRNRVTLL